MKKVALMLVGMHFAFLLYASEQNLIEAVHCTKNSIRIILNDELKKKNFVLEDFFVDYTDEEVDCTRLDYSIVTMPVVMNMITLIWASGDVYYIDAMDRELYYSLQIVKEVFKRLYKSTLWHGELKPRLLVDNSSHFLAPTKNENHVALLFSHGLDSVCTSLRHKDKQQLLITAWGHSDCPLEHVEVWQYLHSIVTSFAHKFKHTASFFSSNYHKFLNFKYIASALSPEIGSWRMQAVEGLGWIGLVAPVLVSKGYKELYIAATITWDCPFPGAALPMIDENVAFAGVRVVHDAFDMSRQEKSKYVSEQRKRLRLPSLTLRVCPMVLKNKGKNCSDCEKCLRTMAAFLLLGEDVKKFGFKISNNKAIKRIKAFLPDTKIVDKISQFWRVMQQFAKDNLEQLSRRHRLFAEWLIQFDIDTITIFLPSELIDWNDFVDLYKPIPAYLLTK